MTRITTKVARNQKVNTHEHLKLVHSFRTQIQPLRDYLNQLLKMVPQYAEPGKRQAFLDHVCNVVRDHGNDGLKLHRGLFIQGVKVLGEDSTTDFTGFACDSSGFPRHYGDLFRLLRTYRRSEVEVRPHINVERPRLVDSINKELNLHQAKESIPVMSQPTDTEVRQISLILSILRWPYSIKLDLSNKRKEELLSDFARSIQDPQPKLQNASLRLSERIAGEMLRYLPENYKDPLEFVPFARTYKGGRPGHAGERRLPLSLAYATGISPDWSYGGPVGSATVLSEKGGKTRFITSYDGAINSSNIYEKARAILDNIEQDCSSNQQIGHTFLQSLTANAIGKPVTEQQRNLLYSTDLDAFTDRLVLNAYRSLLDLINSNDFIGVITAPILVNGKLVHPHKSLMGLRGTFELASIVHHGIATICGLHQRVLCGDDLFFSSSDKGVLQRYEQLCSYAGLSLNRKKTVISVDTGVFCGKVYFRGQDVSPVIPPLYTFSTNTENFISSAGAFIASAARLGSGFTRAANKLVLRFGRFFRGVYLPFYLPFKLGGIGIARALGLLSILKSKMARLACRVPEEPEKVPTRTVRYPFKHSKERSHDPLFAKVLGWNTFGFNNLLDFGATQRFRKKRTMGKRSEKLKDLHSILCYYYGVAT